MDQQNSSNVAATELEDLMRMAGGQVVTGAPVPGAPAGIPNGAPVVVPGAPVPGAPAGIPNGAPAPTVDGVPIPPVPEVPQPPVEGEKKKSKVYKTQEEIFSDLSVTPDQMRVVKPGSPKQQLMSLMDTRAMICGFITPTDSKMILSTKKSDEVTDIIIKDTMSNTIAGVIIKYPRPLAELIEDAACPRTVSYTEAPDARFDAQSYMYREYKSDEYAMLVLPLDDAIDWISSHCWESIAEAPELFVPYVVNSKGGKKMISSPSEVNAKYTLLNKCEEWGAKKEAAVEAKLRNDVDSLKKYKTPRSSQLTPLKSYRKKILQPGNYIALAQYETEPVKAAYSQAEIDLYLTTHVRKAFPAKQDAFAKKISSLTPKSQSLVTVNATKDSFAASTIFAASNSAITTLPCTPWFGALNNYSTDKIALVKRVVEDVTTKTGTKRVVREVKNEIGAKNSAGQVVYSFDPTGKHKKIVDATGGVLNERDIAAFIKTYKDSKSRTKGDSKKTRPSCAGVSTRSLLQLFNL